MACASSLSGQPHFFCHLGGRQRALGHRWARPSKCQLWELLGGRSRDKVRLHALIGSANPGELVKLGPRGAGTKATHWRDQVRPFVAGYQDMSMAKLVASA